MIILSLCISEEFRKLNENLGHMAAYIPTMSAEQQETFDIEVAQRRLRMRNARKAEEARKNSEVEVSRLKYPSQSSLGVKLPKAGSL